MMNGSQSNQEFTSTMTRSYWCHICKMEFSRIFIDGMEVFCRNCGKSFCEDLSLIESESDHPSNFVPYSNNSRSNSIIYSTSSSTTSSSDSSNRIFVYPIADRPARSPILEILSSLIGSENSRMESILNYIMQNDINRYGNPPAGKDVVDNLEKFEISVEFLQKKINNKTELINNINEFEYSCSVCKDEFQINDKVIKIPCKHIFHQDCILPWLKDRNSCPTCRFELPTDDQEYEDRKGKKANFIGNTNI